MVTVSDADTWWDSLAEDRKVAFYRWLGRGEHHTDTTTAGQLDLPLPLFTDRTTP